MEPLLILILILIFFISLMLYLYNKYVIELLELEKRILELIQVIRGYK